MDRASNCSILVGCWQAKLYEKFKVLVVVNMNMHCSLEWDTTYWWIGTIEEITASLF